MQKPRLCPSKSLAIRYLQELSTLKLPSYFLICLSSLVDVDGVVMTTSVVRLLVESFFLSWFAKARVKRKSRGEGVSIVVKRGQKTILTLPLLRPMTCQGRIFKGPYRERRICFPPASVHFSSVNKQCSTYIPIVNINRPLSLHLLTLMQMQMFMLE